MKELTNAGAALEDLLAHCQSELERTVLRALSAGGLPLPSAAQYACADSSGALVASADFYYAAERLVVLVDGPPHALDYVQAGDQNRRARLKGAGYSVLVITHDAIGDGLKRLSEWLGVPLRAPAPARGGAAGTVPEPVQARLWAPWIYDESARALHLLLHLLADQGMPPPDEVGRDLMIDNRVVATVELCWSVQHLAVVLPDQVSEEAQQKLTAGTWQVITADPGAPDSAAALVGQVLLPGVPHNTQRTGA